MVIHDAWLCYPLPWAEAGVVKLSVSMNVIVISAQGDQFDTWLCNSLVLQGSIIQSRTNVCVSSAPVQNHSVQCSLRNVFKRDMYSDTQHSIIMPVRSP